MLSPDAGPLVAALERLSEADRSALVRALMRRADGSGHGVVWHQLAALAADVSAAERQALEDLERAADDFEVGGIV